MTERIKVSAIVSTYKSERFIEGCLRSLTEQSLFQAGKVEIIVIDANSPENERDIVEMFQKTFSDHKITYHRTNERIGLYAAWNLGVQMAAGNFITNANTDDRHSPLCLEKLATALELNQDCDLAYSDCYVTSDPNVAWIDFQSRESIKEKYIYPSFKPLEVLLHYPFGPQPMWRKSVHRKIGFFDESLRAAADWDFAIRFAEVCRAIKVNEPLGIYLKHENAISFADSVMSDENRILKEKYHSEEWVLRLGRKQLPSATDAEIFLRFAEHALKFAPAWHQGKIVSDTNLASRFISKARQLASSKHPSSSLSHLPQRVLLIGDFFLPSIGGSELFLEKMALELKLRGNRVEIACRAHENRAFSEHQGIPVHSFDCSGRLSDGFKTKDAQRYRDFVFNSGFDSVLILTHPDNWNCVFLNAPPTKRPRMVCMPSINLENVCLWNQRKLTSQIETFLRGMDGIISVTESGHDAQFLNRAGIPHVFIPHAVDSAPIQDSIQVRQELLIQDGVFLMVCVANFWPVKNQLALVKTISGMTGNWQLLLIGHKIPYREPALYFQQLNAEISNKSKFKLVPGLPPADARKIIAAADLVVLPSRAESAGPLVVIESMASGVPWLATPECNAVSDQAGGIVTHLENFPSAIRLLMGAPNLRKELGALGKQHWSEKFTWPKVADALWSVLSNTPLGSPGFLMPQTLRAKQKQLLSVYTSNPEPESHVDSEVITVIIPTYNRSAVLNRCLNALHSQSLPKHLFNVVVVDDGSTDNTSAVLSRWSSELRLRALKQSNQGPARARNAALQHATGDLVMFVNDDTLLAADALENHLRAHLRHSKTHSGPIAVLGSFSLDSSIYPPNSPLLVALEKSPLVFDYCKLEGPCEVTFGQFYTCNLSAPISAVRQLGGFHPDFERAGAEDIELGYRFAKSGGKIFFDPACQSLHSHRLTAQAIVSMFKARGHGSVDLYRLLNHLNHHSETMTPPESERLAGLIPSLDETVSKICGYLDRIESHDSGPLPVDFRMAPDGTHSGMMKNWQRPNGEIVHLYKAHLELAEKLELSRRSVNTGTAASAILPILHLLKFHGSLQGLLENPRLRDLIEKNRLRRFVSPKPLPVQDCSAQTVQP